MMFNVRIDATSTRLEVHRDGDHYLFRLGTQPERNARLAEVEPGIYSVLVEGRSYEAHAEPGEDCTWVTIRGRRFRVAITDPRRWAPKGPGNHGQEREVITAPMPGKIVRMLVSPGDAVEAGQGIAVVEAMKMQNEMKTRRGGRIASVAVHEGDTVVAGAILATLESASE